MGSIGMVFVDKILVRASLEKEGFSMIFLELKFFSKTMIFPGCLSTFDSDVLDFSTNPLDSLSIIK